MAISNASMSQEAPSVECKVCHTVLDYGGSKSRGKIFVVCDDCEKNQTDCSVVATLPAPESLKNM